ncbi:hypothetical protein NDU88_001003 [Pleurodeles waltl]|uniref:Transposase IS30-like HTH domain-containing protein n=1 Tax=Pleurodeles waltl TaxID=8319 RepID=A0AAV7V9P4_PLEWA|nr:hypothetical protein NDU88_001003 [Pleurodeles waltl]
MQRPAGKGLGHGFQAPHRSAEDWGPPTPPDYTDWVLTILHPEGLTGLTGGMDSGTSNHATQMEGTKSATAFQGDRGTSQDTGEGYLDIDEQAGHSHSPGWSPCSSPTQENTVTPNTQSRPAGQGRHTHTSGPRAQTCGTQLQRPQSPTPNMQEDEGPSTSGTSRPAQGTQAQGARARSSAPVGQAVGHRIDAAAQDVIAEVLGAYQHTQDRLAQIVSTLEQSQRMQLEQHQQAMEQWKEHNATMATIAGALLQLVNKHADTHTGQEAPTTALDNQQQMTQAAEAAQEIPFYMALETQLRSSPPPTISNFLSFGKMGQKKDLTGSEKSKIVRYLAEGCSTLKIAKLLKRDHRTIKRFIQNSQQGRKKRVEKPRRKITAHELRKVKRAAATMPLATSLAIFQSCNITGVPKSTRCAILRDMAKVRKAERRPPLNKTHKLKRQDWAKKYLKTDFSKVLWTDEMRVSLDGPDGWARGWIGKGQRAPV